MGQRGVDPCSLCGTRPQWCRGLCNACYGRERAAGRLRNLNGTVPARRTLKDTDKKRCRVCGEEKLATEFWGDRTAPDRKQSACKPCSKAQTAAWRERNPEAARGIRDRRQDRARDEWRNWKYGLTPEDHARMLEAQGYVCALCGKPPKGRQLAVDHDHSTGVVRGLLCSPCNTGLGKLGDSIEGLERALAYLRRSAQ